MEMTVSQTIPEGAVAVCVVREKELLEAHPFFKQLAKGDQQYLLAFQKKSPIKDGHSHLIFLPSGKEMMLFGISENKRFTHRKAILAARRIVAYARRERVKKIAVTLDDLIASDFRGNAGESAEIMATQFEIANFEFTKYKTTPTDGWNFVHDIIVVSKRSPKAVG